MVKSKAAHKSTIFLQNSIGCIDKGLSLLP